VKNVLLHIHGSWPTRVRFLHSWAVGRLTRVGHTVEGKEKCPEQICLITVLNVNKISIFTLDQNRGCMPAHQHCDLFYPLVGDLIGFAINWVMLRSFGPGQVLGSYMANQMFAMRLVQWLDWVFETQERKKENCRPGRFLEGREGVKRHSRVQVMGWLELYKESLRVSGQYK